MFFYHVGDVDAGKIITVFEPVVAVLDDGTVQYLVSLCLVVGVPVQTIFELGVGEDVVVVDLVDVDAFEGAEVFSPVQNQQAHHAVVGATAGCGVQAEFNRYQVPPFLDGFWWLAAAAFNPVFDFVVVLV